MASPHMQTGPSMSLDLPVCDPIELQEETLPIANVAKLMKGALPEHAKVSKEAKDGMQAFVTEFISFVTSEAADRSKGAKRRIINGEDIIFSLSALSFSSYSDLVKIYLSRWRLQSKSPTEEIPPSEFKEEALF